MREKEVALVTQRKGFHGEETINAAGFPSLFVEVFNFMTDVCVYHCKLKSVDFLTI